MILEIDMGNTRLKWRVRHEHAAVARGTTGIEESLMSLIEKIEPYRNTINNVYVASVVGALFEQQLTEWSVEYLGLPPVFARACNKCGVVRNGYREPQMLGVDRWLGMVAAYRLVSGACVVVSCGTAVTVDLLGHDGKHMGGFIAPGLNLMLDSLTSRTRQIKLDRTAPMMSLSAATTTSDAIYSACAAMLTGLVDNGVRQLCQTDPNVEFQMIFTGGDADKLLSLYPQAQLVPDLVLDGLTYVLDYPQ